MFCVYILESGDHRYVGYTRDVKRRLKEHNASQNISTKAYVPWELIYVEAHTNSEDAKRREAYFKTSQGRQALSRMLRNHYQNRNFGNQRSTTGKD